MSTPVLGLYPSTYPSNRPGSTYPCMDACGWLLAKSSMFEGCAQTDTDSAGREFVGNPLHQISRFIALRASAARGAVYAGIIHRTWGHRASSQPTTAPGRLVKRVASYCATSSTLRFLFAPLSELLLSLDAAMPATSRSGAMPCAPISAPTILCARRDARARSGSVVAASSP